MADRISPIHLKQFIGKLIEDESTKMKVLALVDRHIETVRADKSDLVNGLQQLMHSPVDGKKSAKELIERFGKMPQLTASSSIKGEEK